MCVDEDTIKLIASINENLTTYKTGPMIKALGYKCLHYKGKYNHNIFVERGLFLENKKYIHSDRIWDALTIQFNIVTICPRHMDVHINLYALYGKGIKINSII